MNMVEHSCQSLTYNKRAELALMLTSCHLSAAKLDFPCNEWKIQSIKDDTKTMQCVQTLASNAVLYSTYNNFFTHIDNICFYVKLSNQQKVKKK